ncbi:MAG TPA: ABC transporter ATP-binding protein [Pirellulaceae bacterium]|nr:ABC transporter ATP-binding protein [Pirellulaceae bacterium]
MPVLEARHLSKTFGQGPTQVSVLRGVDVVVNAGEFLAIMGPSGCGKSTLLHLLGGIEPPSQGQVLLQGEDFGALDDTQRSIIRRRRIGFVFQKINLLPTLSAIENVALPLMIDAVPRADALRQALVALEQVGIAQRAKHFPSEMSGGEQQRVAIARALVIKPAVILADEPTGALDSASGLHVVKLLRQCVEYGQTVVMVTHDHGIARQADRVVTMRDGLVVEGQPVGAAS